MAILPAILKALGALVIILAGCELFTNAIEWFGRKLNLSQGAVGSVFAAVGTALPETIVPIVAIVFLRGKAATEIGTGAILGAPFMLGTLAFTITGLAVFIFRRRRRQGLRMEVHPQTLGQDLAYFVGVYLVAICLSPVLQHLKPEIVGTPIPSMVVKGAAALGLLTAYALYVRRHLLRHDEEEEEELRALYLHWNSESLPRLRFVVAQLALALGAIFLGAHLFVRNMEQAAGILAVSPLVLSLVITPVATELPEKFNSVIWVRQGKDTLAMGNISGAMVFQSCIPVAVGITMTDWALDTAGFASAAGALLAGSLVYIHIRRSGHLSPWMLLLGLPIYIAVLSVVFHTR